ncbi:MAG TPA: hypothetical protein VFG06_10255 [Thermodesulfovibrionales bacterium]|nr:hypothetical protein [Thermodesulfovibrionales bacterium]
MLDVIRNSLKQYFDETVVNELLEAYQEAVNRFYRGDLGPHAVAGGRFCEAVFRILQEAIRGQSNFTPIGSALPSIDTLMGQLATDRINSPMLFHPWQQDSVGLHIPRALRVIYDIRNNRDAAHLADGIDPNQQDATLIICVMDWVMAELLRLFHNVSADEAHQIVKTLIARKIPVVQKFGEFPKVLKPKLILYEEILILLYDCRERGATIEDLRSWIPREALLRFSSTLEYALRHLEEEKRFIHFDGNC